MIVCDGINNPRKLSFYESTEVEIYDMMGRKVVSSEMQSSSVIEIDNLSSGIYMIRSIDVNNNVSTKKFIKK